MKKLSAQRTGNSPSRKEIPRISTVGSAPNRGADRVTPATASEPQVEFITKEMWGRELSEFPRVEWLHIINVTDISICSWWMRTPRMNLSMKVDLQYKHYKQVPIFLIWLGWVTQCLISTKVKELRDISRDRRGHMCSMRRSDRVRLMCGGRNFSCWISRNLISLVTYSF